MTKLIFNMKPGPVMLSKSGIKLKQGGSAEVKSVTEEMKLAEKRGLIKIGDKTATPPPEATPEKREWMVDYSKEAEGEITVHDLSTGRKLTAAIEAKKGDQHYKLENIGTVNGQIYHPTQIAKEHFDGLE
jgi:hypothetical protein